MAKKVTYKDAGVDLDKYADAMARLPKLVQRTFSPRVQQLEGGFAGLFRLDFPGELFRRNYEDPVLVSCTDGVGTKLKLAAMTGIHNTVGIDLVAMSVNDAICCGAEPLFFLDYVAMPKDAPELLEQIVEGISQGCLQSGCALLGGETAIMPDLYREGDYDLAGFCVGVADRAKVIDGKAIGRGDAVIGVASSGFHSNGFSLVRKIVFDLAGLGVNDQIEELGKTVGQALIEPTRIYVRAVRDLLTRFENEPQGVVHGIAHITGGGLHENLSRILPDGVDAVIERDSWTVPLVFNWLQKLGDVEPDEMMRVFNMGLGLVLIVAKEKADEVRGILSENGYENWLIGQIESGEGTSRWGA